MQISLDLIKPSPNPVRTQRDEEKMNELTQSIKEQGLIVPIKIRPLTDLPYCTWHGYRAFIKDNLQPNESGQSHDDYIGECTECDKALDYIYGSNEDFYNGETTVIKQPFEIVYGHRRFEASLQLNLESILAIIDRLTEDEALIESLIENIQREDMTDIEVASGIKQLYELFRFLKNEKTHGNQTQEAFVKTKIGNVLGMTRPQVQRYINMLNDNLRPIVDTFYKENPNVKDVKTKAEWLQTAMPDEDIEVQKAVARKAVKEELGQHKVKQVAQSVAAAPTPEAKKKLLEWEFNTEIHNPERIKERVEQFGEHDPLYLDETPSPQSDWEKVPEIKIMVDGLVETIKVFTKLLKTINKASKIEGRLSFEAKQFTATKLRKFRDEINTLLNELEMN